MLVAAIGTLVLAAPALSAGGAPQGRDADVPSTQQDGPAPDGARGQGPAAPGDFGRRGGRDMCQPLPGTGCVPPTTPMLNDPMNASADWSPKPAVQPKTAADEQKLFQLQSGYHMELVLSEPDIAEPAQVAFDGNGRMYVLELRSYMQTIDGQHELEPISRISRHEDRDGDGVYERHTVFVDKLVFPRFVMPFGPNGVLTKSSNDNDVWLYTDTDNDGVADKKELFTSGYGRAGNVEHQESAMTWALDNWIYSTINAFRVRWTPHGVVREPSGAPGGQWGLSQDDDGKIWVQGGASGLPAYFQLPLEYGTFTAPDQTDKDLVLTWGAPVLIGDMRPGTAHMRLPDGSLAIATAGAGANVFRGHRLPPDLRGDYFYGEVVGRIVRRVKAEVRDGITYIKNYYLGSEFIRQTDPLFRPVSEVTAPDGTMYVVDMYRGIIQEAAWTDVGSYLRAKIEQYQLDKVTNHGRIWRLTYDGMPRDRTQPRMLDETPAQLVRHLTHENGWWRDTAQQLLVLRQDKSVAPALQALLRGPNVLGRIHALWTLEGLGALDAATVRGVMKDASPRLRVQALRASESLYKSGDRSFADDYRAMTKDADTSVAIQALLSLNQMNIPDAGKAIEAARATNTAAGVQIFGQQMLDRRAAAAASSMTRFTPAEAAVLTRGETIYEELCFACHGDDGRGATRPGGSNDNMAPALAGSPRVTGHRDYVIKVLLYGLTGPVAGRTYGEVMVPMGSNTDEYIAAAASYVRNAFGNDASLVTPADVVRVRAATAGRNTMWTVGEIASSLPAVLTNQLEWKLTASHNSAQAGDARSVVGWQSGAPQTSGMWLQIELPQPTSVTEMQFESAAAGGARGGGGGAGGGFGRGRGAGSAGPSPQTIGYPRAYQVQVSDDGAAWKTVAEGQGTGALTAIAFAPVRAKFVRLTEVSAEPNAPALAIRNLQLLGPAGR
jgi:mono/diheme cytochrome c family protein